MLVDAAAPRWWWGLVAHVVPLSGAHTGGPATPVQKVIWFSSIGRNSSACKSIEWCLYFFYFYSICSLIQDGPYALERLVCECVPLHCLYLCFCYLV